MEENLRYISVLSPAATAGDIVFNITTYNLETNLDINIVVSAATSYSEYTLAGRILTELVSTFAASGASFVHIPYPNEDMVGEFAPTRSDHVVCIMSMCDWELDITSNPTGAMILASDDPALLTLSEGDDFGIFEDIGCSTGVALTNTQKANRIAQGSARLIAYLNNNIVLSTYIHREIGNGNKFIQVKKRPLVNFYTPRSRPPFATGAYYPWVLPYTASRSSFGIDDPKLGMIAYLQDQNLVDIEKPFGDGNEIIVAYEAGYRKIPAIIKECAAKFTWFLDNNGSIAAESVEGVSETNRSIPDVLKGYSAFLKGYKL